MKTTDLRGYDLAVETMAHIELTQQYDETLGLPEWDQENWGISTKEPKDGTPPACGSAFCFAGWARELAGVKQEWRAERSVVTGVPVRWIILNQEAVVPDAVDLLQLQKPDVDPEWGGWIGPFAELWSDDMPLLFEGGNDIDDLYMILADTYGKADAEVRDDVAVRQAALLAEYKATKS